MAAAATCAQRGGRSRSFVRAALSIPRRRRALCSGGGGGGGGWPGVGERRTVAVKPDGTLPHRQAATHGTQTSNERVHLSSPTISATAATARLQRTMNINVTAKFHYTDTDPTRHVRACDQVSDEVWSGPSWNLDLNLHERMELKRRRASERESPHSRLHQPLWQHFH